MSKTVARLKKRFAYLLDETEDFPGPIWKEHGDGWWAFMKEGWRCQATQSRSCHERTLRDLEAALRNAKKVDPS